MTMFLAMDVVLLYHFILTRRSQRSAALVADHGEPLLKGQASEPRVSGVRTFFYV